MKDISRLRSFELSLIVLFYSLFVSASGYPFEAQEMQYTPKVEWGDDINLTDDKIPQITPTNKARSIAADNQGRIHVVWQQLTRKRSSIFYKSSLDGGLSWEKEVLIANSNGYRPSIAADSQDGVHIVWSEVQEPSGYPGIYSKVYYKRSLDGGITWDENPKVLSEQYPYDDADVPTIAVDTQDRIHVTWEYEYGQNRGIYYSRSLDGGETWEPSTSIVSIPAHFSFAMATGANDSIYLIWSEVIWSEDRPRPDKSKLYEIYFKSSLDGGITWEPTIQLTDDDYYDDEPVIATDILGGIHVAWTSDRYNGNSEVYYARSLDGGQEWDSQKRICINNSRDVFPTASITADGEGRIHIVYNMDNYAPYERDLYYIRSLDRGESWEPNTWLSHGMRWGVFLGEAPCIATDDWNALHVVWCMEMETGGRRSEIYYKRGMQE